VENRFLGTFRHIWIATLLALGTASCDAPQLNSRPSPTNEAFYRGKTISIIVGASTGGQYDTSARAVARYLPKYIPGRPKIIVQNMPGGGGLTGANHVFNVAPRDGSVIGIFPDATLLAPLWRFPGAHFDPRNVRWLGSIGTRDATIMWVRSDSPAITLDQMKIVPVTVGASGPTSTPASYALLMNELLGTKIKVILGYPGSTEIMLAMERGEVHGRVAGDLTWIKRNHPEWLTEKFVTIVAQLTPEPIAELPNVPMVRKLARNSEDELVMDVVLGLQAFNHIYAAPPAVPAERASVLRKALQALASDKDFVAEITRTASLTVKFSDHRVIEAFLDKAYALPEETRRRTARYLGAE
jgi:tripartite-type tricarboxylate transporter receptor subunit TctC